MPGLYKIFDEILVRAGCPAAGQRTSLFSPPAQLFSPQSERDSSFGLHEADIGQVVRDSKCNAITWIEVNAADNFVRDPVNMNKIEVPRMLLINRLYGRLHYRGKPVVL